jgi:hypothetical protein
LIEEVTKDEDTHIADVGILLAILASIVFWLRKTPAVSRPDDSMAIDETVLPDLDVNAVSRIDVYLNGSSAVVSRVAGRWTVATSQGYPADFDAWPRR